MRHFIQFVFILMVVLFFATGSSFQSFADSKTPAASDDQKPLTGHVKVKPKPTKKPVLRLLKPDLTIKSPKIFPANPTTQDTIKFYAYVHNIGRTTASASENGIKIGGETYPMVSLRHSLPVGSNCYIMRQYKFEQPGIYWVRFIADVGNDVSELNEDNNIVSLQFEVLKPVLPDLMVTNITNNSSNCMVYTIKNLGGPIPSSVNRQTIGIRLTKNGIIGYSLNNLKFADPNCNLCQPNGTVTVTSCHPGLTTGPWFNSIQAKVEVDYTNKLEESNESNNTMEVNGL